MPGVSKLPRACTTVMPAVSIVLPACRAPLTLMVDSGLSVTVCLLTSAPATLTE